MDSLRKKSFYGNRVGVMAFIFMFTAYGSASIFAILLPEISSAINKDPMTVAYMASFFGIGGVFGNFISGKLFDFMKVRYVLVLGCVTNFAGYAVYATGHSLTMYFVGATLLGLGASYGGLSGSAVMIQKWFLEKREKLIGVSFAGAGLGAGVWMFVSGQLITIFDYRIACWAVGFFILLMSIPALIIVKQPEEIGEKPLGWEKYENMVKQTGEKQEIGLTFMEAIKNPIMYLMSIAVLLVGMLMLGFETYAPAYWQENGVSVTASANYLVMYYIIGAVMTIVSGYIAQKVGVKAYIIYINVAFMIGAIFCVLWGSFQSFFVILLIVLFMGIAYPLFTSVPATITTQTFGNKDYPKICGVFNGFQLAGSIAYPIIIGWVVGMSGTLNSAYIFLAGTAFVVIVMILIGLALSPYKKILREKGVHDQLEKE